MGLKAIGSIVAWGSNEFGQCDLPAVNVGFIALAAGSTHSLGLKNDGWIVAWGSNDYGQCNVPEPNTGFIALAAGSNHSLALKQLSTAIREPIVIRSLPKDLHISSTSPNPFNPSTVIEFQTVVAGYFFLRVFDVSGRVVIESPIGHLTGGTHHAGWNGLNAEGLAVSSGCYFMQVLRAGGGSEVVKGLLVR
ncbi:MAG: hypothetical protein H6678_08335 [Candidatus Delongbacteria bacterium]|nr:hypothetical protein [Candidatus Delongbacteria bacterium]